MGHIEARTDPVRQLGAQTTVVKLADVALQGADRHLQVCWSNFEQVMEDCLLPPLESCAYRTRRLTAMLEAMDVVKIELDRRGLK